MYNQAYDWRAKESDQSHSRAEMLRLTWRAKESDRGHKPLSLVVLKLARKGTWCSIAPIAALQR